MSKEDENQYIKDVVFFCYIIMHKQRRILLEDIIEEKRIFSSKLDLKLNLNKDKDLYPEQTQKKFKAKVAKKKRRSCYL